MTRKKYETDIRNGSSVELKPGWGERLGYGVGNLGVGTINTVIGTYLLVYLTNTALLDVAVVSVIFAVSRVFDGISDLLIGNVIDNTESKMGKAKVWLMRMCIPLVVSVMLLFWVPPHFPVALKYVYVFLMYNIVNTVIYTFTRISYTSLISLISADEEEHGLLGVISSLFGNAGTLIGGALFVKVLAAFADSTGNQNTQKGFTITCLIFCVFSVLTILVTLFTTKERVKDDGKAERRSMISIKDLITSLRIMLLDRSWVVIIITTILCLLAKEMQSQGGVYYAMYVLHNMEDVSWIIATILVPTVVIQLVMPLLMKKISKKAFYVGGVMLQAGGLLGFALVSPSLGGMIAFNIIKGIGTGMATGIIYGLIADMVSVTNRKTGYFMPGAGFAVLSASNKLGQGLGSVVFGLILAAAGFNGALETQPAAVPAAVSWAFLWVPMILCIICAVIFWIFYDPDKTTDGGQNGENDIQKTE